MQFAKRLASVFVSTVIVSGCAETSKSVGSDEQHTAASAQAAAGTITGKSVSTAPSSSPAAASAPAAATSTGGIDGLRVYLGSAAEIGAQQGQDLGPRIADLVQQWLDPMVNQVPLLGSVMANVKANNMSAHVPQDELDEMQALADASGVDLAKIQIANYAPDLGQIAAKGLGAVFTLTDAPAHFGCSSFVVAPSRSQTGAMIVGRNLDYPDSTVLLDQWEPVVFAKTGALKILSVHIPGMTGLLTAINERGVYMAIHVSEGVLSSSGQPITTIFRQVLETATSTQEAVDLVTQTHPALAANVMITDGKDAAVVEIDNATSGVRSFGASGVLYNANHFVLPEMAAEDSAANVPDDRWPILQSHDADSQKLGVKDVQDVIRKAGGFNGGDTGSNILAVTMDYATWTLTFASDPGGQVKAVDGGRTFSVDVRKAFAAAVPRQ